MLTKEESCVKLNFSKRKENIKIKQISFIPAIYAIYYRRINTMYYNVAFNADTKLIVMRD